VATEHNIVLFTTFIDLSNC